jgi:hypothetical protein
MAYYTALIAAWNGATQPPAGVTGTALTGLTTANKIIAVNGWTVTGSVPTSFATTGAALLNCINWTEFAALTAQQQSNLLALLANPGPLLGGSANAGLITAGMFLAYFSNHSGPTILALNALAKATVTPWWQASVANGGAGLNSTITQYDITAAGGLS